MHVIIYYNLSKLRSDDYRTVNVARSVAACICRLEGAGGCRGGRIPPAITRRGRPRGSSRSFFGDHDRRRVGVPGRHTRHDRGVDHAQSGDAVDRNRGSHTASESAPIRQVPTGCRLETPFLRIAGAANGSRLFRRTLPRASGRRWTALIVKPGKECDWTPTRLRSAKLQTLKLSWMAAGIDRLGPRGHEAAPPSAPRRSARTWSRERVCQRRRRPIGSFSTSG